MRKIIIIALLSMNTGIAFAETPEGFYQEKYIRTKARALKSAKARLKAEVLKEEKIEVLEKNCHSINGEFIISSSWTTSRRAGARYNANSTAVVSCLEVD